MPPSEEDELAPRSARILARGRLALLLRHRPAGRSDRAFLLCYRADQSLGHLAESVGIPRLEIGRALVDGAAWPLELPPPDDALVELFPIPEPLALEGELRFLLDVHLGVLARMLRLLGFDASRLARKETEELLGTALAEDRIILSRDRALLFRRELHEAASRAMLILSPDPYQQLLETARRFGLARRFAPFSRCAHCASPLRPATREELGARLPPRVAERYTDFFLCPRCGKAYWKGDHFRNIQPFLRRLSADLGEGGASNSPPPSPEIPFRKGPAS